MSLDHIQLTDPELCEPQATISAVSLRSKCSPINKAFRLDL